MNFIKTLGIQVYTAIAGATGKEAAAGGIFSAISTSIIAALGGWNITLQLLLFLMVFDFATGFLAALKAKSINSDIMLWGGVRKAIVLVVIALAGLLDAFFIKHGLMANPLIQTAAYFFYLGREGLSLVENLGKLNVLVPDIVKDKLAQLKSKEGGNSEQR